MRACAFDEENCAFMSTKTTKDKVLEMYFK